MLYNILNYLVSVKVIQIISDPSEACTVMFIFSFGLFGFLHLVNSILEVLLQPPDLRVHTHFFVGLQSGNHLEGAVGCVDESEFSDVAFREVVDR